MQNLDIFIYTNTNTLFVTTQCTDLLYRSTIKTKKYLQSLHRHIIFAPSTTNGQFSNRIILCNSRVGG